MKKRKKYDKHICTQWLTTVFETTIIRIVTMNVCKITVTVKLHV